MAFSMGALAVYTPLGQHVFGPIGSHRIQVTIRSLNLFLRIRWG